MSSITDRNNDLLVRILDYCDRIKSCTLRFGNDFSIYEQDPDYQDVIKMNLFQILNRNNKLDYYILDIYIDKKDNFYNLNLLS